MLFLWGDILHTSINGLSEFRNNFHVHQVETFYTIYVKQTFDLPSALFWIKKDQQYKTYLSQILKKKSDLEAKMKNSPRPGFEQYCCQHLS